MNTLILLLYFSYKKPSLSNNVQSTMILKNPIHKLLTFL